MISKTSIIALSVLLAACGSDNTADQQLSVSDSATVAPTEAPAPAVTDPQIAAIVLAANTVDVNAGELAESKATDPEVKAFAQQMVAAHNAVNQQATDLMTRLGATPEENATSDALTQGGAENVAQLDTLSGAAFDKAYIDHEVAYHQQVLDALDQVLIPGSTDPELNALLVKARPVFAQHLSHAQQIQARLNG